MYRRRCVHFSPRTPPSASPRGSVLRSARLTVVNAATSTTTVERRAADVAVLGSSCVAVAAAYSLARRGKKVVLLPDLGLTAPRPAPEAHRPLQLTHPDAAVVSLAAEAAAYWRGLQAQAAGSGLRLLADCRSLDVGLLRRGAGGGGGGGGGGGAQDQAAELLGRMQDACKAAGVRLGSLRGEELGALFPAVRLPAGAVGLLQPEGGVLHSSAAHSLLLDMAERQGVLLRDRLVLRGWRDAGSHFVLRASGALLPDAVSVFEVEQLLLAPGVWAQPALRMFGADAALQAVAGSFVRCSAAPELAAVPLWRFMGLTPPAPAPAAASPPGGGAEVDDLAPLAVTGFPAQLAAAGSGSATMKLALGVVLTGREREGQEQGAAAGSAGEVRGPILDPWAWQPEAVADRSGLAAAHRVAGRLLRGVGPLLLPLQRSNASAPTQGAGSNPLPLEGGHTEGGRTAAPGPPWGDVAVHTATPDGWPVLGFLPGFEPGRLLFAATASCSLGSGEPGRSSSGGAGGAAADMAKASGSTAAAATAAAPLGRKSGQASPPRRDAEGYQRPGGTLGPSGSAAAGAASGAEGSGTAANSLESLLSLGGPDRRLLWDGYQLSPLLAKMAVDLLCGAARPQEADPERLGLDRPALGACSRAEGLDPWDGLARWQSGEALRSLSGEGDAEEARERAEALAGGARMVGADAGAWEGEGEGEERRRKVFL